MTNRTKTVLTAASLALGAAGVVFVGYLSANPLAFTHAARDLPSYTAPSPASRVVDRPTAIETEDTLALPDVTISSSAARSERSQRQATTLKPCSEWTEIGALYITTAGATGVRQVRRLCSETTAGAIPSK